MSVANREESAEHKQPEPKPREVRYRHSPSFVDVLREVGCSLLVSTYQAGKLGTIGVVDGRIHFSFHNFDQARMRKTNAEKGSELFD